MILIITNYSSFRTRICTRIHARAHTHTHVLLYVVRLNEQMVYSTTAYDRVPITKRLLTFSMYAAGRELRIEKEKEKEKVIIDSTIVSRENRERVNAIENKNVKCFSSAYAEKLYGWKFSPYDLKGVVESVTSSLSREFLLTTHWRQASPSLTLQLPSFDRSLIMRASCVNNFYLPRWQSSNDSGLCAEKSNFDSDRSIQSRPINVRLFLNNGTGCTIAMI